MRLPDFIISHLQPILIDWVQFARTQTPAASSLDEAALLDHGKLILEEIAADMQRPQGNRERRVKSEGNSQTASTASDMPSRSHARQRARQGFEIVQMVAEYRALRATVLRQWAASSDAQHPESLEDVTRFNEAVDQALAESIEVFAAEVEQARDLFLAVLGHDLRGPLGAISASAALTMKLEPTVARPMTIIARSVAQMKGLIDDIVEYTRHQLGSTLAMVPVPLNLGHFVRDTLDEISAGSPNAPVILETTGDLQGEWDKRGLHQALSNLVFNALKYGFAGSLVRVTANGEAADTVVLAVENSGKPIPEDSLGTLFDPLVRAAGNGQGADTSAVVAGAGANLGLGLFVVRSIAIAHGGTVTVASDEAMTRFEMRLPRFAGGRP